jgi:hypothetical protein
MACKVSQVNVDNYNKIQPGMSFEQVKQILGEPTDVASMSFGELSGTSASWKSKQGVIVIQFLNNSVKIKSFNQVGSDNNQATPAATEPSSSDEQ